MVRLVMPDVKLFKEIVDSVSKIATETAIVATPQGVELRAMDVDQSSLLEIFLPPEVFQEYAVDERLVIGVSLAHLKKVLAHVKKGDLLALEATPEEVKWSIQSLVARNYRFRNIEVPIPEISELQLGELNVEVTLHAGAFKKAVEDIAGVAGAIEFDATSQDVFVLRGVETSTRIDAKFRVGSLALVSYTVKEPSKATYDVNKLQTVVNIASITDVVKLEYSGEMPLKITYNIGTSGRITYYLAPFETG